MKLSTKLVCAFFFRTCDVAAEDAKKFREQFTCSWTVEQILKVSKEFDGDVRTIDLERPLVIFVAIDNFTFYFDFIESDRLEKMVRINFDQNISQRKIETVKCL